MIELGTRLQWMGAFCTGGAVVSSAHASASRNFPKTRRPPLQYWLSDRVVGLGE